MKIFFNPKADWRCGFVQWMISENINHDEKFSSNKGRIPWMIGGWWWAFGFFIRKHRFSFTWYIQRYLASHMDEKTLSQYDFKWYGTIECRRW